MSGRGAEQQHLDIVKAARVCRVGGAPSDAALSTTWPLVSLSASNPEFENATDRKMDPDRFAELDY